MKKITFHPLSMLVLFLCLSLLGGIFVIGASPRTTDIQYRPADFETCLAEQYGYTSENKGEFHITADDPHIVLDFTGLESGNTSAVTLHFKKAVKLSHIHVYFGRDDSTFNETDCINFQGDGSTELKIISASEFSYLRIDVDEDFAVDSLSVEESTQVQRHFSWKRWIFMLAFNVLLTLLAALIPGISSNLDSRLRRIPSHLKGIPKYTKAILLNLAGFAAVVLASFSGEILYDKGKNLDFSKFRFLTMFAAFAIITLAVTHRKRIVQYAHIYFFIFSMLIGTVHVIAAPPCSVSWDEQIHYERSAYLSWAARGDISNCDYMIVNCQASALFGEDIYNRNGRTAWAETINHADKAQPYMVNVQEYKENDIYAVAFSPETIVAYVPSAFGLAVGRCFGLSFTHTFMLGKWMNLLCYSLLFCIAVKLLKKCGKLIAALIGLIPTCVFIATTYSYDWWVISMIVLGYSICLGTIQAGKKLSTARFLGIMVILILGILPKATYFPLLFPMMLLKKDHYENSKLCRIMTIVSMVFLLSTFLLPMIIGSGTSGDARGGSDINPSGQLHYILSKPLTYTKTLLSFLASYLSLDNSMYYLTIMAYYGTGYHFTLCILILAVCAILDNREVKKQSIGAFCKAGVYFAAFGAIVLAATALYISYTPVGENAIYGCQPRYILPVVFPVVYCFSELNLKIPEKLSKNIFALGTTAMSLIFLYNLYTMCVKFY